MPIDRIEPMFSVILLHYTTPTLPVLLLTSDIFKKMSQLTKYLLYFLEIFQFCVFVLYAIKHTTYNL